MDFKILLKVFNFYEKLVSLNILQIFVGHMWIFLKKTLETL